MDCKATIELGDYSRGGKTRGNNQAQDHDLGKKEKYIPCGIVDEDKGKFYISFGNSYKTSDFMVDSLSQWWDTLEEKEQKAIEVIQIKLDNGPENSGVRTQFLKRMVDLADEIGKSFHLLYFPPYHSKYNPIERCWGILEQHWNGTLLRDVNTMLGWAKSMTWKGEHPLITLNEQEYKKGIKLTKKEMKQLEKRLTRNPYLPKWDILIHPNSS
jgi:transposase